MNKHESATVANFILKEKRDRYAYLLDEPSKRPRAVRRLNHCKDLDPRSAQCTPPFPVAAMRCMPSNR